jgi:hypothetical protein
MSKEIVILNENKATKIKLPKKALTPQLVDGDTYYGPVDPKWVKNFSSNIETLVMPVVVMAGFALAVPGYFIAGALAGDFSYGMIGAMVGIFSGLPIGLFSLVFFTRTMRAKAYKLADYHLSLWFKEAHNLNVDADTVRGLNAFYLQGIKDNYKEYPHFTDVKGDRYWYGPDASHHNKVNPPNAVFIPMGPKKPMQSAIEASKILTIKTNENLSLDLTPEQQNIIKNIQKQNILLDSCDLTTEEKYTFDRVDKEVTNVLNLHIEALRFNSTNYNKKELDLLLSGFLNELIELSETQLAKIKKDLTIQKQLLKDR